MTVILIRLNVVDLGTDTTNKGTVGMEHGTVVDGRRPTEEERSWSFRH